MVGNQSIVAGRLARLRAGFNGFAQALAQGNRQRLAQLARTFFVKRAKGLLAAVVDDLKNAIQGVAVGDGCHQHLAGSVTRAFIHRVQKTQGRVNLPERPFVVNIGNVHHLACHGDMASNALRTDGQFEVAAGVEPGLDFGDDGVAVFAGDVEREPVGIEQRADVRADFQHDLCNVVGFVNAVGDLLQLAEIKRLEFRAAVLRRKLELFKKFDLPVVGKGVAGIGCHQNSNSCPALSH